MVMGIDIFFWCESMLKLREQLVDAEEDRLAGKKGYTRKMNEVEKKLK